MEYVVKLILSLIFVPKCSGDTDASRETDITRESLKQPADSNCRVLFTASGQRRQVKKLDETAPRSWGQWVFFDPT